MLVFALRNQYKGHESTWSSKVLLTKTLSVLFLAWSSVIIRASRYRRNMS